MRVRVPPSAPCILSNKSSLLRNDVKKAVSKMATVSRGVAGAWRGSQNPYCLTPNIVGSKGATCLDDALFFFCVLSFFDAKPLQLIISFIHSAGYCFLPVLLFLNIISKCKVSNVNQQHHKSCIFTLTGKVIILIILLINICLFNNPSLIT